MTGIMEAIDFAQEHFIKVENLSENERIFTENLFSSFCLHVTMDLDYHLWSEQLNFLFPQVFKYLKMRN